MKTGNGWREAADLSWGESESDLHGRESCAIIPAKMDGGMCRRMASPRKCKRSNFAARFFGAAVAMVAVTAANPSAACESAIKAAAAREGVPLDTAMAVAQVESGMQRFAINSDGRTWQPGSLAEAARIVRKLFHGGAHQIDVGCMQISLRYHPGAFRNLEEAFDDQRNVDYGVRLLKANKRQHGSWGRAVAFYHSGSPAAQAEYVRQVASVIAARKAHISRIASRGDNG